MIESCLGRVHRHRLRVRFAETDQMRVAHHSSYVPWIEEARTEWMRASGRSYRSMEDSGLSLAVTRMELRYRVSAAYDDLLEIETSLATIRKASLDFSYKIWRIDPPSTPSALGGGGADDALDRAAGAGERPVLLAEATTRLALLGPGGRPMRLPEDLLSGGGDVLRAEAPH